MKVTPALLAVLGTGIRWANQEEWLSLDCAERLQGLIGKELDIYRVWLASHQGAIAYLAELAKVSEQEAWACAELLYAIRDIQSFKELVQQYLKSEVAPEKEQLEEEIALLTLGQDEMSGE